MKLCRFNDNRIGVVEGETVIDVTDALGPLSLGSYPGSPADPLIENLPRVRRIAGNAGALPRHALAAVRLLSPVARPAHIMAAPVNYLLHQAEALADGGRNFVSDVKTIEQYGLFLKSCTALVGPAEGVTQRFPERRTDHEIELVAVIGRGGDRIRRADALSHVAGYCVGLDMTIRGAEDRSLRKSVDSYAVLGPWLVTADEVPDPGDLMMTLAVNGQVRQQASTKDLIFDVPRLIEYASSFYRLYPGDLLYTGTPQGVAAVVAGDVMTCTIERIGSMTVGVRQ